MQHLCAFPPVGCLVKLLLANHSCLSTSIWMPRVQEESSKTGFTGKEISSCDMKTLIKCTDIFVMRLELIQGHRIRKWTFNFTVALTLMEDLTSCTVTKGSDRICSRTWDKVPRCKELMWRVKSFFLNIQNKKVHQVTWDCFNGAVVSVLEATCDHLEQNWTDYISQTLQSLYYVSWSTASFIFFKNPLRRLSDRGWMKGCILFLQVYLHL